MNKEDKTVAKIFFPLVLVIIIALTIKDVRLSNELSRDFDITVGHIIDFGVIGTRTGDGAEYQYTVNGINYTAGFNAASVCRRLSNDEKEKLKIEQIPFVFNSENPTNSEILLKTDQYEKYGVSFPAGELGELIDSSFNCKNGVFTLK